MRARFSSLVAQKCPGGSLKLVMRFAFEPMKFSPGYECRRMKNAALVNNALRNIRLLEGVTARKECA